MMSRFAFQFGVKVGFKVSRRCQGLLLVWQVLTGRDLSERLLL